MGARENGAAFVIDRRDNVATALKALHSGPVPLRGDATEGTVKALEKIPAGHKLALRDIAPGEDVIKYGVRIGVATAPILEGAWVHLHVMRSAWDERSSHLDLYTGAPKDVSYE